MYGYVVNKTSMWQYCMKREVKPNAEIPLSELYEQYGKKHGIAEGEDFVNWLKSVKLKNRDDWEVVFVDGKDVVEQAEEPKEIEHMNTIANTVKVVKAGKIAGEGIDVHHMTVRDVVKLPVRKAREVVPLIMDVTLLKYALQEAKPLPDKDSLCQILRKRIDTISSF